MALSDLQLVNLGLVGAVTAAVASSMVNAQDAANALFENDFEFLKTADDGSAAAATAEFVLARIARRAKLVDVIFTPATATGLTSNDTSYASLILQSRDGAGGAAKVLSTTTTKTSASGGTGNWTQWVNVPGVVTAFDPTLFVIPAGGFLTFQITKASSGVVVPGGTLTARLQYL